MPSKKRSKGTLSLVEEKKLKTRYRKLSYGAWITGFSSLALLLFQNYGDILALIRGGMITMLLVLDFIGFCLALLLFSMATLYSFLMEKRNWVIANALLAVVVFLSLYLFSAKIPFVDSHGTLREITPHFLRYIALGTTFGGLFLALIAFLKRKEN
ncbi:hypothetical protein AT15_01000 [Kosmotoga arenicorallina S304]|uniref:Uncharacterized protein n=1 Tax=Kosmotoga arenicorallina S304 TaxID=1453497 RepID=A0A176K0V1_9BACT|nr:hypothetical protein [Kosmotoga arenicorallina]OAA30124.1 hypothetical protein AT15_01000 [Kosmotoga arenicorallina S304]